jgi:hypothetical protein
MTDTLLASDLANDPAAYLADKPVEVVLRALGCEVQEIAGHDLEAALKVVVDEAHTVHQCKRNS